MSYEFKRLSDVEELAAAPEGAKALAVVDGSVKQVPFGNGNANLEDMMFDLSVDLSSRGYIEFMDTAQVQKMYDANMSLHIVEIIDPSGERHVYHHVIPFIKDTLAVYTATDKVGALAIAGSSSWPQLNLVFDMEEYSKNNVVVKSASVVCEGFRTVVKVYASVI